jgi:hypothetical protein
VARVEEHVVRPGKDGALQAEEEDLECLGGIGVTRAAREDRVAHDRAPVEAECHAAGGVARNVNHPHDVPPDAQPHSVPQLKVSRDAKLVCIGRMGPYRYT